ncbi:MAG: hypothetical protein AB1726_18120 [Planctomycetota bacterium]
MPRRHPTPGLSAAALVLAGAGAACRGPDGRELAPPAGAPERPALLACLHFYRGQVVGSPARATGLQRRTETGWESMTWSELISSALAVDPRGEWLYLAAGDGVHVSRDGGRTFQVAGGIDVAEVQGVAIDARDPRRAWAATAYGVFRTDDVLAERPWRPVAHGEQFGFASAVAQDPADPRRLLVASEGGVFASEDEGESFARTSPEVRVRRLAPDRSDPRRWWAASDGLGLLASADGGRSWQPTGAPAPLVFCVEQDPSAAPTLYAGAPGAVHRSDDGGETWTARRAGIPAEFLVLDLAVDPADRRHVVATGTDGLLESVDGGRTWAPGGFAGAIVADVAFATLAGVPAAGPSAAPGALRFAGPARSFAAHRPAPDPAFLARRDRLLGALLAAPGPAPDAPFSFAAAWLEIARGRAGPALWARVEEALADPTSSLFHAFAALALALHAGEEMPPALRARFRARLTAHPVYRGDTENHWVLHYATLLLAAQTFPATPAAEWYLGRDTQSVYDEAREWLFHWARLTATRGQGEFDSPQYVFFFLDPLLLLHDFAAEPEVRQLAGMMLDLVLADYLSESVDGAYAGGHSRELQPFRTTDEPVAGLHDLYAGGIPPTPDPSPRLLLALLSRYVPPAPLAAMANTRDGAWVQTEVKRVRNVIRFGATRNPPVHEVEYVTPGYILGSLPGGILQPIQQHTWDVTWRSASPGATLFTVHPFVSARELAMFFPEDLHVLVASVTAQKGIYASPDKPMSSSPYEQVFQHENVLLALYQVPAGERFPHVDLHVPRFLAREEAGGWWFGRDGDFQVAWHVTAPGEWAEHAGRDRFRCAGARAGFVVVTRPPDEPPELFRARLLAAPLPLLAGEDDALALRWTDAAGRTYEKRWGEAAGRVGGEPAPFPAADLFAGPFLTARVGEGVVTMRGGGATRVLDFSALEIRVED